MKNRIDVVTAMIYVVSLLSTLLLISTTALTESGDSFEAKMQKVSSKTVKWVSPHEKSIPYEAVVGSVRYIPIGINKNDLSLVNITDRSQIREERIYVCRTQVNGTWVPGAIYEDTKVCVVSVQLQVFVQDHYEILRNVEHAARLVWKDWEVNQEMPEGAISVGNQSANDYYVARSNLKTLRTFTDKLAVGVAFCIGKVDPNELFYKKLSVIDESRNVIRHVVKGQVLVELEPMSYELNVTKLNFDRRKIITSSNIKLQELKLRNELLILMENESEMTYLWKYNSYWGQGRAMLKRLPTKVHLPNEINVEDILWGLKYEKIRNGIERVKATLEAGTGLHVTLQATLLKVEVPYTATLLSVFNDSATMSRTINGTWVKTELVDIKKSFGSMCYLHNNSTVPMSSTTTTTTLTPTSIPVAVSTLLNGVGENRSPSMLLLSPRQGNDESNSLNDDNDATQLRKKDDRNNSASRISKSTIYLLSLVLLVSFQ